LATVNFQIDTHNYAIETVNCTVRSASESKSASETKIQSWCAVQEHHFVFCKDFNTSGAKVLNIVACVRLLSNAIK